MIEIFRATDPMVLEYLGPLLPDTGNIPRAVFIEKIFFALTKKKDKALLLIACEGEEILGFIFAYDIIYTHFVWVDYMEFFKRLPQEFFDRMIKILDNFTLSCGKKFVRFETTRQQAFERKYAYATVSTIMEKEI